MTTGLENVATDALSQAGVAVAAEAAAAVNAPAPGTEEATLAALEAEQAVIDADAAKALETGTTGSTTSKTADATTTGNKDATAGAGKAAAEADPKVRVIIAMRKENQRLQSALDQTTGAARVLEHMVQTGVVAQPGNAAAEAEAAAAVTPQDQIAALDEKIFALAQDVEDGKIDMPAYKREELRLMDERTAIQQAAVAQPAQAAQSAASATMADTTVQDHLNQLLTDHPYLKAMSEDQLSPYQEKAIKSLQLEGKLGIGNRADMAMRERMAEMVRADHFKMMGVDDPRKKVNSGQGAGDGTTLSAAAQAREAKLTAGNSHPVDISKTGSGATSTLPTAQDALNILNSFGGDEDAQIRYVKAHPEIETLR